MTWSFAVHIAAVLFFTVVPRDWWQTRVEEPDVMVINIGGSEGPQTGGFNSLPSRVVEQVTPEPKRPEPIPPSTSKPKAADATVELPKPAAKPPDSTAPPDAIARPQATGREITQGNAKVETGVKNNQGTGLAQGGQGLGQPTVEIPNFCCADYLIVIKQRIEREWKPTGTAQGTTTVRFVIQRDGTIKDVELKTPSGVGLLDREAQSAVLKVGRVPAIPAAHLPDFLAVQLTFVKRGPS